MRARQITRQVRRMRQDWDQRARENARYYVATAHDRWSDEEFFRSGQITVEEQILNDLENVCQGLDPKAMRGFPIHLLNGNVRAR